VTAARGPLVDEAALVEALRPARDPHGTPMFQVMFNHLGRPNASVAAFGTTLHVSGRNAAALEASTAPFRSDAHHWTRVEPGLEDVFISLMDTAKDNFQ